MSFFEAIQIFGIIAVAVLAFLVNVVVELTKSAPGIKRMPTSLYTVIVSVLLSGAAYFVAIGLLNTSFVWYELTLCVVSGFPIAYIAMFGWEKFNELWNRFKK